MQIEMLEHVSIATYLKYSILTFIFQEKKQKSSVDSLRVLSEEIQDFKDKLQKQIQIFESEIKIQVGNMRMAIERSTTAEDRYMAHVTHLTDELKRIDQTLELEK